VFGEESCRAAVFGEESCRAAALGEESCRAAALGEGSCGAAALGEESCGAAVFGGESFSAAFFFIFLAKNYTAQLFLAKNQIHISSHPSSLAPCKFLLFLTFSIGLKGHFFFAHIEEISKATAHVTAITKAGFSRGVFSSESTAGAGVYRQEDSALRMTRSRVWLLLLLQIVPEFRGCCIPPTFCGHPCVYRQVFTYYCSC